MQSVVALQMAVFACEARGYNVSYEWRRHRSSGAIGRQSSLTITRATPPDEDQYYCIAMTEGGYVFSDNVTLIVDGEEYLFSGVFVFKKQVIIAICSQLENKK